MNISRARLERSLNLLEIIGIVLVLATALFMEIALLELPCPLCLLQRVGLYITAFSLLLNLRFGIKPSHYAMAILGAIFTAAVALRQIALHIVPGTGTYGSPLFGLHLYTWSFIVAVGAIIFTTILLMFDRKSHVTNLAKPNFITNALFFLLTAVVSINVITVYLDCGFKECSDNPQPKKFITYINTIKDLT